MDGCGRSGRGTFSAADEYVLRGMSRGLGRNGNILIIMTVTGTSTSRVTAEEYHHRDDDDGGGDEDDYDDNDDC